MKICGRAFSLLTLYPTDGDLIYTACCPSWLKYPYNAYMYKVLDSKGSIDFEAIWNSSDLLEFRKSILDGSYKYCNELICPLLSSSTLTDPPEKAASSIRNNDPHLDYFPIEIAANIDKACNLCCPSCRSTPNRVANPKTYQRFIDILKAGAEDITLNGSGETFFNSQILKVLRSYSCKDYPSVKMFRIITNGTLLNKTMWFSLSEDFKKLLKDISVSVDSFSEKTYKAIRPGGNFITLQKNLKDISDLRISGKIETFKLTFVLQKKNYMELVDIVKGSLELKPDQIHIISAANWGHHSEEYFKDNIMLPPDFQDTCSGDIREAKKLIEASGIFLLSNIL